MVAKVVTYPTHICTRTCTHTQTSPLNCNSYCYSAVAGEGCYQCRSRKLFQSFYIDNNSTTWYVCLLIFTIMIALSLDHLYGSDDVHVYKVTKYNKAIHTLYWKIIWWNFEHFIGTLKLSANFAFNWGCLLLLTKGFSQSLL